MNLPVIGAGGGGGGGSQVSTPIEAPDSLHSRDSVVLIDALSEGEIFGLVDGLKSVYLNDTPIQNANGSYNFTNITIGTSNGTQTGIAGSSLLNSIAADVRSEVIVGARIMQAVPVVRRIADLNVNAVDVRLSTPRMVAGDTLGNQSATSINFTIEISTNGGGYAVVKTDAFSGKTTSKYDRTYRLTLSGTGPWDIRITRTTADSVTSLLQNELWFDALTAIVSQKLSYPNTALVAMAADARAFQSVPKRSYDIKGLIVRVPSNYNPVTRSYTGLWNGTFSLAWTDNPAWCFYDLLTNSRYGLGGYLPSSAVDKWGLYAIGQYCDALVPDGFGGTEPRFTLNCYMATRAEAFTVVNQLASAFRGMIYWASGTISTVQDAPTDPTSLYTRSNVIDGAFWYAGASRKAMHTVALVTWNDPANHYQSAVEYVEDAAAIAIYGVIETQIVAAGCTSRGQAHRLGQWILYSEKLEQEVITFKAAMDSAYVRPGQIIKVQDTHRAGKRVGGRLAGSGNTVSILTLDAPVTIESGKTYSVAVVLPDGSIGSATVTNGAGATSVLTLSGIGLTAVPQPNAIWVMTISDLSPTLWRVMAVAESARNEYSITALAHNPTKFSAIENGTALQLPNTIAIPVMPAAPLNITFVENVIKNLGVVHSTLTIGWDSTQYATKYRVSWRTVPGNFTELPTTSVTNAEIMNVPLGVIEVRVSALNALGLEGPATSAQNTVLGTASSSYAAAVPPAVPPTAPLLTAVGKMFAVVLSWVFGDTRTDIRSTEIWWSATNDRTLASRITQVSYPSSEYSHVALSPGQNCYYWIRVLDTSGNFSPWYPALATGGLYASPSTNPAAILAQLNQSITSSELAASLSTPIALLTAPATTAGSFASVTNTSNSAYNLAAAASNNLSTLSASVGNNTAAISTEATARTSADAALSTNITTLTSTVAGVSSSVSTSTTAINGLSAQYTVKVDVNGYVSGYGLASTVVNGTPSSLFLIRADTFAVGAAGSATKYPFVIGNINGVSTVGINGALVVDGSITAGQINGTGLKIGVGGQINLGSYTGYAWPAAGLTGVHISDNGLLFGNPTGGDGKYFQIYTPGGGTNAAIYTNIPAYLGDASVTTLKVAGNAITAISSASAPGITSFVAGQVSNVLVTPYFSITGLGVLNITWNAFVIAGGTTATMYSTLWYSIGAGWISMGERTAMYEAAYASGSACSETRQLVLGAGTVAFLLQFRATTTGGSRVNDPIITMMEAKR